MKKDTLYKFALVLVFLFYAYYTYKSLVDASKAVDIEGPGNRLLSVIVIIFIIIISGLFILHNIEKKTNTWFSKFFFLWMIGGVINVWLLPTTTVQNLKIMNTLFFMLPYFIFSFFYWISERENSILPFVNKAIIGFTIIVFFFQMQSYLAAYLVFDNFRSGSSYFYVFMLPFVLYIPNKFWKFCLITIIIAFALVSLKRGGLIALLIAFYGYYWVNSLCKNKSTNILKNSILSLILLFILIGGTVVLDQEVNDGLLIERMEAINDDEGSGRVDVYNAVVDKIKTSSIDKLMFGHGFESTKDVTMMENEYADVTAHNDLLEVFYDFGIIMFVLYLSFWVYFLKYLIKHIKYKTVFAAPLAVAFILFVVLSTISHIIIYPHIITISMFLGLVAGRSRESLQSKNISL